jgi:hypothetical protein
MIRNLQLLAIATAALMASAQSPAVSAHAISIAVDPRSSGEAQAELITNGFRKYCPDVAIVRDEADAQYILLASESNPLRGFLLHYYITIYDKKGTAVFSVDKNHDKSATKAACKFITDAGRS